VNQRGGAGGGDSLPKSEKACANSGCAHASSEEAESAQWWWWGGEWCMQGGVDRSFVKSFGETEKNEDAPPALSAV
jgi:hypothetical protein